MATENKLNKRNKKMENKQSIEISHQALNSNLNEILQGLKNLNSKGTPKVIQSIGSIKYNNLLQDYSVFGHYGLLSIINENQ